MSSSFIPNLWIRNFMEEEKAIKAIENGAIDTSTEAKTMPNGKLRMAALKGSIYKQVKIFKGALCLGVKWVKQDG